MSKTCGWTDQEAKPMADERDDSGGDDSALDLVQPAALAALRKLAVRVEVRLGATGLSIGELLAMQPGSVLALERAVDEPVELIVNDSVIARGEMVSVEGEMGVRITEIVAEAEETA
jgi:flagellar motor switch protein FliN/FliY